MGVGRPAQEGTLDVSSGYTQGQQLPGIREMLQQPDSMWSGQGQDSQKHYIRDFAMPSSLSPLHS